MFADLPCTVATTDTTSPHWHVMDHYTGDSRLYHQQSPAMRQWIRRHGGMGIVEVDECDDPDCLREDV